MIRKIKSSIRYAAQHYRLSFPIQPYSSHDSNASLRWPWI